MYKKQFISLCEDYSYIIILGFSSLFVLLKSYFFSYFMSVSDYAQFNVYLLAVSLVSVAIPLGFSLRCHIYLPKLYKNKDQGAVAALLNSSKLACVLTAFILVILFLMFGVSDIVLLGLTQGFLFALFFVEQISIKSQSLMKTYAKNILSRNVAVAVSGIACFIFFGDLLMMCCAEVAASALLVVFSRVCRISWDGSIIGQFITNKKLFFSSVMGLLITFSDRVFAVWIFTDEQFSLFSYGYLLVGVALVFQQYINTKVVVDFSLHESVSVSFKMCLKVVFFSFLFCILIGLLFFFFLSFNSFYFDKFDSMLIVFFLLYSVLKGCDYFSIIFLSHGYHKKLIFCQAMLLGSIFLGDLMLIFYGLNDLYFYLLVLIFSMALYYIYCVVSLLMLVRNEKIV